MADSPEDNMNTDVASFHSIITLVVFLLANAFVVFPFDIPILLSPTVVHLAQRCVVKLGLMPPGNSSATLSRDEKPKTYYKFTLPFNFVTAPLTAVIFLLMIQVIGRTEVREGIIGVNNIIPINIMGFFLALAYLAISLDRTGLIRFLASWVLKKGGKAGHRLYLLLYMFFFVLGTFIGNDPIILSGTAFLAYLTRVAANIKHPRAWIYSQFAMANISSAILVSSNLTNLVLAGAFNIRFLTYTANMIVPVIATVIILFPCLLYIIFPSTDLIPRSIEMHTLPEDDKPGASEDTQAQTLPLPATALSMPLPAPELRQDAREQREEDERKEREALSLKDIIDPSLDKPGALFGGSLLAIALVVILATNAVGLDVKVFEITVPAAFIQLCRDGIADWSNRSNPDRQGARQSTRSEPRMSADARYAEETEMRAITMAEGGEGEGAQPRKTRQTEPVADEKISSYSEEQGIAHPPPHDRSSISKSTVSDHENVQEIPIQSDVKNQPYVPSPNEAGTAPEQPSTAGPSTTLTGTSGRRNHDTLPVLDLELTQNLSEIKSKTTSMDFSPTSLPAVTVCSVSSSSSKKSPRALKPYALWNNVATFSKDNFPTVYAVLSQLPYPLLPFSFSMFILVQGLATKGWVALLAKGWAAWIGKTGTVGAVGGMGFVSVCMCNFTGTNIGATILLSRILQDWLQDPSIPDRVESAAIYALALGVNYGAFSATFSASLAGLLWRDILQRKFIRVRSLDFARINLPIIAITMAVGCGVLTAQVFIVKSGAERGASS